MNQIKMFSTTSSTSILNTPQENQIISFKMKLFDNKLIDELNYKPNLFDKPNNSYYTNELIVNIRGHVRDSFNTPRLYLFLKKLSTYFTLKIYIHTWNKKANNISWREYPENNDSITEDSIRSYFKDIEICCILIDDDTNIKLIGDTKGNIFSSSMPKIGWKNMWYGMYQSIHEIYKRENNRTIILNTRFDLFINSNKIYENHIIKWINNTLQKINYQKMNTNYFLKEKENLNGVDNQILGDKDTLYKLIYHFHHNLDEIHKSNIHLIGQEHSVYYENIKLSNTI
jgi:hypothetical protein